jgi:NADPH:quinone reductase
MRAIQIERYGGPEVLLRKNLPVPTPGPGEVLIRVAVAGVNFMDIHTRQGKYARSATYPVPLPCTLGMEGAGEVVSVGAGVRSCATGDRVAWCISWGSYADYAVVPERLVAPVPDALPLEMAAAAMFQGCTAHYLFTDVAQLASGDTCLVHAATGAIGQLLLQMARARGVTVYATAGTPSKAAVARELGAAAVFSYDQGRFVEAVRDLTGGRGVDVVFDAVGRTTLRDSFRCTRRRGLVINYGAVSGPVRDLDPLELGEAGSLFLTRPRLADHLPDHASVLRRSSDIFSALVAGTLRVSISGHYSLDDVEQAHARLESRQETGKAVVRLT